MRFHQTIAENGKRLRRIAALLLAIADLAERAAGRAPAICRLVLWLIRPAEAVAGALVAGLAPGAVRPSAPVRPGPAAAEALRLAQNLRWLAAILAAIADHCPAPHRAAGANGCCAAGWRSRPLSPSLLRMSTGSARSPPRRRPRFTG